MQITKNTHNFENYPAQQLHQLSINLRSTMPLLLPDQLKNSPGPINSLHQTFPCLFISLVPPFHTLLFSPLFPLFLSKLLHLPQCSNESGQKWWTPLCYQQELRTNLGKNKNKKELIWEVRQREAVFSNHEKSRLHLSHIIHTPPSICFLPTPLSPTYVFEALFPNQCLFIEKSFPESIYKTYSLFKNTAQFLLLWQAFNGQKSRLRTFLPWIYVTLTVQDKHFIHLTGCTWTPTPSITQC